MKRKTLFKVFLALLGILAACSTRRDQRSSGTDTSTVVRAAFYYTCPMHPSVRSDHPGACPVCGMALVKRIVGGTPGAAEANDPGNVNLSPAQLVLADVSTDTIRRQTLEKEIASVGVVSVAEPYEATIAARFRGRVEKLYASVTGESVKKGEPLFALYSPDITSAAQDYILALDASRATAASSGPALGSTRDQLIAASRTRLRTHFGMTDEQIRLLERSRVPPTTVRFDAPIKGTIIAKNVKEGQYVDEGMVLYQVADLSKVWMNLDVYEQDIRLIRLGQNVTVTAEAYPGKEFHGDVTFIDPTMNSDTRTVRVRTEIPNPDRMLKPNMFVTAHIRIPIRNALAVPNDAILRTGVRNIVWVESRPGVFQARDVVIGSSTDSQSEVLAGLTEGDIVAASGGFLIDSESQLTSPSGASMAQHAGTRMDHAPAADNDETRHSDSIGNGSQLIGTRPVRDPMAHPADTQKKSRNRSTVHDVTILVEGSYAPDEISARVGEKLRLHFYRTEDSECTAEVVFEDFGIRKFLPPRDTVLVEITPTKAGTFGFHCGMGMVQGTIIVSR